MTERFSLLAELGRGGMGVVWTARDEETGQIVALKLLRETYAEDADYITRFERELELAKRIHSRNVVQVLGYGVRYHTPYLALEYVDGPSLRERLTSDGPYSWTEGKALLAQIAQGLADAHEAGVIHRDLKPSNVLIGSDGIAKLADFGIAKGLDLTRVTGTSTLLGTPAYLAPEGPADERSDLYSLGVIAFEILTGVVPFEGWTYQEVILRHVREAPDLGKLPEEARQIVGRLLAKNPNKRPQSARDLVAMLEQGSAAPGLLAAAPEEGPATPGLSSSAEPPAGLVRRIRRRSGLPSFWVFACLALAVAVGLAGSFLSGAYSPTNHPAFAAAPTTTGTPMPDLSTTRVSGASFAQYEMQTGDTLHTIAAKINISVPELIAANPQLTNPDGLVAGETLNIPPPGYEGAKATATAMATATPTYAPVVKPTATATAMATAVPTPTATAVPMGSITIAPSRFSCSAAEVQVVLTFRLPASMSGSDVYIPEQDGTRGSGDTVASAYTLQADGTWLDTHTLTSTQMCASQWGSVGQHIWKTLDSGGNPIAQGTYIVDP